MFFNGVQYVLIQQIMMSKYKNKNYLVPLSHLISENCQKLVHHNAQLRPTTTLMCNYSIIRLNYIAFYMIELTVYKYNHRID